MKRLNASVYNRLLAQAQEAKERGLEKLASGILNSIGSTPEDEKISYSYDEMQSDVYEGLWKLANSVIKHYDVQMVDAEKVDVILSSLAFKLIEELEESLDLDNPSTPLDPKVPGEL